MVGKFATWIAALSLLAGCATEPVPLKTQAQADLQSVDSVLLVPQRELGITVAPTYLGGGLVEGLIALYIDKKREDSAKVAASPILKNLEGYDFRRVMLDAWAGEFAKIDIAKFRPPTVANGIAPDAPEWTSRKRADLDRSDAGAVLFATIDHSLQSGALIVTANVEIFPKSAALTRYRVSPSEADPVGPGSVIYRNTFTYKKEFINANNVQRGLDEGALDIARKAAADIGRLRP